MQPPPHDSSENLKESNPYDEVEPREPSVQGRAKVQPIQDNEKAALVSGLDRKPSKKEILSTPVKKHHKPPHIVPVAPPIKEKETPLQIMQKKVQQFIESVPYTVTMMIVTVYALFGDDIRQFGSSKNTDVVFYVLTIICMILFAIEIILNCICKPDYIFGFYFWLDLIATVSMFLDIGWITESMFGGSVVDGSAKQMKQVGTASKAGRRAGQVIRVIRLVRLVKLYKHASMQYEREQQRKEIQRLIMETKQAELQAQEAQKKLLSPEKYQQEEESKLIDYMKMEEGQGRQSSARGKPMKELKKPDTIMTTVEQPLISSFSENIDTKHIQPESKVGQNLGDRTMRSVITIILSIVISVPLFNYTTYKEVTSSYATGLDRLYELQGRKSTFDFTFKDYVSYHGGFNEPVIYVFVNITSLDKSCCAYDSSNHYDLFGANYDNPNDLRLEDTNLYLTFDEENNLKAYSVTDNRYSMNINAGLSIIRTVFVSCVLAFSAVVFSKDVQTLVLDPIDRMLKKVDRIAKNPLEAAQIEEQEELILERLLKQNDQQKVLEQKEQQGMETQILEKLIMKIGALLAVGFGEAGSEIIAANMSQGGDVDPMLPGKKMMAIFGFCDIRNFTDATEVLQQGVMMFVNEIAEIVHGTVDHYSGSANKNIGDAFLLVWKYRPDDYVLNEEGKMMLIPSRYVQQLSDFSVMSFLKIITSITISKKLEKYKAHPGLNERLPNYSVKMGFGLHLGWAIEGAIGSNFKIDASYLSPNVNMASRLEAATKQFGSSILISGLLKQQLSQKCQSHLRHIDTVTVKGSLEPVEIHTVDISFKNLLHRITKSYDIYDSASLSREQRKRFKVSNRHNRDNLKEQVISGTYDVADEFDQDPELRAIREIFSQDFYDTWVQGFQLYLSGKWADAQKIFEKTLDFIDDHTDGPSNTLLQVIKEEGGKAPSNWQGFRELTEK